MSVLIHGLELDGRPHKALLTERDGKPVLVVETQYSYADNEVKIYPVEEIPPHGRLIDADGDIGVNVTMMPGGKCKVDLIAPTIIPAEEVPGHE